MKKFEELKAQAYHIEYARDKISDMMETIDEYFRNGRLSPDDAALAINSILYSMLCVNFGYRILAEPEEFEEYFYKTFRKNVKSLRTFSGTCDCKKHECSGCLNDQGDVRNLE